ncbi:MAG: hypothetical protein QOJ89_2665 [bacterium]|jgi:hypothetical protein
MLALEHPHRATMRSAVTAYGARLANEASTEALPICLEVVRASCRPPIAASAGDTATADRSETAGLADRARSADTALVLGEGAVAGLSVARSGADPDNTCHPLNMSTRRLLECASVAVVLSRAGRVLLVGTAGVGAPVANVPFVAGCQLQVDGGAVAGSLAHGEWTWTSSLACTSPRRRSGSRRPP